MLRRRTAIRLKALILILTAIFFAYKFVNGTLYYYIGPRFGWLTLVAVALLILIGGAYNLVEGEGDPADDAPGEGVHAHQGHDHAHQYDGHQHDDHHDHSTHDHHAHHHSPANWWPLLLVSLPLMLGTLVPAQPLGASAISNRGVNTEVAVAADETERTLTVVAGERNVLDWVRAMSEDPDPAALDGEGADVIGFVYRDPRFAENQFMVARFTITCCVADALAIGLVAEADGAADLPDDSWVRVEGTFAEGSLDGDAMPVLVAETVTPIQPPEHPYLYP
jgi:putative membrane protein